MPINIAFSTGNSQYLEPFVAYPIVDIKNGRAILSVPDNKGDHKTEVELSDPDFTFCFGIRMDDILKVCHECKGIPNLYSDGEFNPLFSHRASYTSVFL